RLAADDDLLASLDFVVASVHHGFGDDVRMTERLLAGVRHPLVTFLGHPTGRLFGAREPAAIDVDAVARACVDHGVVLEINGSPTRMDLPSREVRSVAREGVTFVVTPDAHDTSELAHTKLAVGLARRGNLSREAVINTRDRASMSDYLRGRRVRAVGVAVA
ncbi:MAG TPA: DNA polymerase III, partial [Labilithrix sp.]|nr:DNA polymerase III [Labilithrix sp.]